MIFPELRSILKRVLGRESDMIQLDLKAAGGISFDAVNVGWYNRNGFPGIYSILSGGMPAWSGEPVSVETALNHSVVYACKKIVAESVGFIPAIMMQRNGDAVQEATKHPMYNALKHSINDEITAQSFTEMDTGHALMVGNAYSKIIRRSGTGTAIGFDPLQPQQVVPDREKTGRKRLVYVVKDGNSPAVTYTVQPGKPHDILHIRGMGWDGLRGYSVVTMARQSIGTAIAAERNVARFYANGGRLPYILKMDGKFKTDADFEHFRSDWEKTYAEPHRVPILEPPVREYQQIGLSAVDAQLLETRQFSIHEICRWFGVSPHLVYDLSRATFSNIENLALQFVTFTLNTWLSRWEEELWRCVLTDEEKALGYSWRHDVSALLRGDFAGRMQGYASALQNGHMSVDEVRGKEGYNKLADDAGSHYHIQLNMQTLPQGNDPLQSQQTKPAASQQLVRLDK